jgi:putative DNA primase/helicase
MSAYDELRGQAPGKGNGHAKEPATLNSVRASAVTMKGIDWLWPNRFAIGKLGLLVGMPDEGKGQVFSYIAAQVTRRGQWPCGEGRAPLGNVIMLTAEDDIADTVVPRLKAAGADLERVYIIKMVTDHDKDRMFSLVTDLEILRKKITEISNVALVLVDPISAYLGVGKVDSYRTPDVRAVLGPIKDLAEELKISIIGIMHFNKKIDVVNVLLRISDSLAFGAAARHVYAVVDDPEHKRRLVVKGKNNAAPRAESEKALAYHFSCEQVGNDPVTGKAIWAPYVIWEDKHVDVTALEAMKAATDNRAPAARDDAKKFLADLLKDGPIETNEIKKAAEGNGIAWRTIERAKSDLNVTAKTDGVGKPWTWRLPDRPTGRDWHD